MTVQGAGPTPLDRTSRVPLWAQLREDLRRRLAANEFGEAFPGEHALVAEYDVSRHTVREALRKLRSEGHVIAGRGRVSRPAAPIEQHIGNAYSLFDAVERIGSVQRSTVRVLDRRADGVAAARLGLEESTPLVHVERLRLADEEPLAVDRVWLPADLASPLLKADFTHTGLYAELARHCGIRVMGGWERIRALVPNPAEHRLLACPKGTAVFAIDRAGSWQGRIVEWRQTLVRADRFCVTADFSDRDGYHLAGEEHRTGARHRPA
ncbi:GntR family transcriptional regulator [Embleya hyalina]|uniref:GntR family transcriptional regulator n=1 Tax=Embleya hyalina TaxID=516124 RepID=A0A401Z2D5_9ACTN|nr:GntR family transcriptional regulator [Embleya hyalina]GCE01012.1 GntR family transcriptional regulator [Embleya hyalina]